jgi:hypothetical protein
VTWHNVNHLGWCSSSHFNIIHLKQLDHFNCGFAEMICGFSSKKDFYVVSTVVTIASSLFLDIQSLYVVSTVVIIA